MPQRAAHSTNFDLYTDTTLTGWGAVCINRETKQSAVTGSSWATPAHNINAAELRAVRVAFESFAPFIGDSTNVRLYIDNTSALSAFNRGFSRSHTVNAEITEALQGLPYTVTAQYIKSADNPADRPSRDPFYQRHGKV